MNLCSRRPIGQLGRSWTKLVHSDSASATELSVRQALAALNNQLTRYKTALHQRTASPEPQRETDSPSATEKRSRLARLTEVKSPSPPRGVSRDHTPSRKDRTPTPTRDRMGSVERGRRAGSVEGEGERGRRPGSVEGEGERAVSQRVSSLDRTDLKRLTSVEGDVSASKPPLGAGGASSPHSSPRRSAGGRAEQTWPQRSKVKQQIAAISKRASREVSPAKFPSPTSPKHKPPPSPNHNPARRLSQHKELPPRAVLSCEATPLYHAHLEVAVRPALYLTAVTYDLDLTPVETAPPPQAASLPRIVLPPETTRERVATAPATVCRAVLRAPSIVRRIALVRADMLSQRPATIVPCPVRSARVVEESGTREGGVGPAMPQRVSIPAEGGEEGEEGGEAPLPEKTAPVPAEAAPGEGAKESQGGPQPPAGTTLAVRKRVAPGRRSVVKLQFSGKVSSLKNLFDSPARQPPCPEVDDEQVATKSSTLPRQQVRAETRSSLFAKEQEHMGMKSSSLPRQQKSHSFSAAPSVGVVTSDTTGGGGASVAGEGDGATEAKEAREVLPEAVPPSAPETVTLTTNGEVHETEGLALPHPQPSSPEVPRPQASSPAPRPSSPVGSYLENLSSSSEFESDSDAIETSSSEAEGDDEVDFSYGSLPRDTRVTKSLRSAEARGSDQPQARDHLLSSLPPSSLPPLPPSPPSSLSLPLLQCGDEGPPSV